MTHDQKRRLAAAVVHHVGDLLDAWPALRDEMGCGDVEPDDAAAVVARWLSPLPGDAWHEALPQPEDVKQQRCPRPAVSRR